MSVGVVRGVHRKGAPERDECFILLLPSLSLCSSATFTLDLSPRTLCRPFWPAQSPLLACMKQPQRETNLYSGTIGIEDKSTQRHNEGEVQERNIVPPHPLNKRHQMSSPLSQVVTAQRTLKWISTTFHATAAARRAPPSSIRWNALECSGALGFCVPSISASFMAKMVMEWSDWPTARSNITHLRGRRPGGPITVGDGFLVAELWCGVVGCFSCNERTEANDMTHVD